jgi:hypothetical protein
MIVAVPHGRLWPFCDFGNGCARVRFRGKPGLVLQIELDDGGARQFLVNVRLGSRISAPLASQVTR